MTKPATRDVVRGDPSQDTGRNLLFTFLTMHETYHIGQLGLLKKCMTDRSIMA